MRKLFAMAAAAAALGGAANAATVTYNDLLLGSGLSVVSDGVTMTATTGDGVVANVSSGMFAGLWIGRSLADFGTYTLTFSEAITSIELEFEALSNTAGDPAEMISGFATDNGPISISYVDQFGTFFDGSTIIAISANGQGIINYVGAAFTQLIFTHVQLPEQNGFIIERIAVNTIDGPVIPAPPAIALFLSGAAALAASRRKRKQASA